MLRMRLLKLYGVVIVAFTCLAQGAESVDISQPVATGLKTRVETSLFQESAAFYSELIGMTILESWNEADDKGIILGLCRPGEVAAYLELAPVDNVRVYEGLSLQFRVSDISATADRLHGKVEFRGPEKKPWGSTYIHLKDPTGISVVLYEGDL